MTSSIHRVRQRRECRSAATSVGCVRDGQDLLERFYQLMASPPGVDAVAEFYAPDAAVIRFDGTSSGLEAISSFLTEVHSRHEPYRLQSVDQLTRAGDVVMWDAVVETSNGMLDTVEVFVLDDTGKIKRHIPGVLGYWGG